MRGTFELLQRQFNLLNSRLQRLESASRIPWVYPGSGERFQSHYWQVIGGKQLGFSSLTGATYAATQPASVPRYDLQTRPTTIDGVGYIRSLDTGRVALLLNAPPGRQYRALWEGTLLICITEISIPVTSETGAVQSFYLVDAVP